MRVLRRFSFIDKENKEIKCYKWTPQSKEIIGVVQIVHGMTEHALRYEYFAKRLCDNGYVVYSHDNRGHGQTSKGEERGYISDNEGFEMLVHNVKEYTDLIRKENPSLPFILFGHSMGSFICQRYIQLYGDQLDAVILSGTNGSPGLEVRVGRILPKIQMSLLGRKSRAKLVDKLSMGAYNAKFKPNRTSADWLCSVEEEVDKYIADDDCGFIPTISFYYDLMTALCRNHRKENLVRIPKKLPVYMFGGDKDPVGYMGKGIVKLHNSYRGLGIEDVSYKIYKNGRHEMINESNKDEVIQDILDWTSSRIKIKVNK